MFVGGPLLNGYEQKIEGVFNYMPLAILFPLLFLLFWFYRFTSNVNYTNKNWLWFGVTLAIVVGVFGGVAMWVTLKFNDPTTQQIMYVIWFTLENMVIALVAYTIGSIIAQKFSTNYHHIPSSPFKSQRK